MDSTGDASVGAPVPENQPAGAGPEAGSAARSVSGGREVYQVKLDDFEGPLDLLLHLIKKHEVDLYEISVSAVTDQYLASIREAEELNLDIAGEFLVMAATLIYLKSRALLPPEEREDFEDEEPIDPRAGHIPGAVNLPFAANLDDGGRFKGPADLAARFGRVGADGDSIVYCGSGVTACHDLLAMTHAGLPTPRLYPGSWSEWITDPARPMTTGDER